MLELLRTKTAKTAIAGALTASGAYFAGEIGLAALVAALFAALGTIFLRDGVRKAQVLPLLLLALCVLPACATADTQQPATLTQPTTGAQAAGQGPITLSMAGWGSASSVKAAARLGDEQTRHAARSTIRVPLVVDGKPVLGPDGAVVMVEYEGGPIRDLIVIGGDLDASQKPLIGGTTEGTNQGINPTGTQDSKPSSTSEPKNDVRPDVKLPPIPGVPPIPVPVE